MFPSSKTLSDAQLATYGATSSSTPVLFKISDSSVEGGSSSGSSPWRSDERKLGMAARFNV